VSGSISALTTGMGVLRKSQGGQSASVPSISS